MGRQRGISGQLVRLARVQPIVEVARQHDPWRAWTKITHPLMHQTVLGCIGQNLKRHATVARARNVQMCPTATSPPAPALLAVALTMKAVT